MAIGKDKKRIIITLDLRLADWLEWEARFKERSVSWLIGHYVAMARKRYDKQRGMIENPTTRAERKKKKG